LPSGEAANMLIGGIVVDDHNRYAKNPGTDPFGKKFFAGGDFKMDDVYHVALMVSRLHAIGGVRGRI
jgi:hypothetical protein